MQQKEAKYGEREVQGKLSPRGFLGHVTDTQNHPSPRAHPWVGRRVRPSLSVCRHRMGVGTPHRSLQLVITSLTLYMRIYCEGLGE